MTADFDRWSLNYDDSALQPIFRAAHAAVLRNAQRLTQPTRLLDVGCGTGQLLRRATDVFPDATLVGVDRSGGMLSMAHTGDGRRVMHVQAAAEQLPFADSVFEIVVSTASFRHWADHTSALQEIARVLATDGVFCLADVFTPRRRGLAVKFARRKVIPPTLTAALSAAGLRVVSADTVAGFGPITSITVVVARRVRPSSRAGSTGVRSGGPRFPQPAPRATR